LKNSLKVETEEDTMRDIEEILRKLEEEEK